MATEVRTKKWGNSLGVIIPSQTVEKLSLKPEESIVIEISKKENVLKELFGIAKTKKSAREIIKEVRKDLESKWLK
jgi:antitoxin component of MazEF toxin-antitoxin module